GEPLLDYHLSNIKTLHPDTDDGTYYLTEAEYQAITAHPAEHRHENVEVEVTGTSYAADKDGVQLDNVNGAASSQTVDVYVQAVTDDVALSLDETVTEGALFDAVNNPQSEKYSVGFAGDTATVTLNEDTAFYIKDFVEA